MSERSDTPQTDKITARYVLDPFAAQDIRKIERALNRERAVTRAARNQIRMEVDANPVPLVSSAMGRIADQMHEAGRRCDRRTAK